MNRSEYMEALKSALKDFDKDIQDEIINDYEEHFDMGAANGKSEEEIASELGSIDELVKELKSLQADEKAEKETEKKEKRSETKSTEDKQKSFDDMLTGFAGFLGTMAAKVSNGTEKFAGSFAGEAETFAKDVAAGFEKASGKVVDKSTEFADKVVDKSTKIADIVVDKSTSFAREVASSFKDVRTEKPEPSEEDVVDGEIKDAPSEEAEQQAETFEKKADAVNETEAEDQADTEDRTETADGNDETKETVRRVIIETDCGDVTLLKAEGDRFDYKYENNGTPNQQLAYQFDWKQEGDTIKAVSKKKVSTSNFFNFMPCPEIKVTVWVPEGLDRLDVYTVSGSVDLVGVNVKTLRLTTMSGDVNAVQSDAGTLSVSTMSGDVKIEKTQTSVVQLKTVSGDLYLEGDAANVNAGTTSGDLAIKAHGTREVSINTVSGDSDVFLVGSTGYHTNIKTVSGDLSLKYGEDSCKYLRNGLYTFGDGSCNINISSVSGDIKIEA